MKFTKKDLIYLLGFFIIIYYFKSTTEKMSNTNLKKLIEEQYMIDVDAIRNLSKLANDLTINNKLVIPGGLEIKGNLKVDGNVGVGRNPHPDVGLYVDAKDLLIGIESEGGKRYGMQCDKIFYSKGTAEFHGGVKIPGKISGKKSLHVSGETRFDSNVGVRRDPHSDVGLFVDGSNLIVGVETKGAGIYSGKGLHVKGTSYLNGNVGVKKKPDQNLGLLIDDSLQTNGDLYVAGKSQLNGHVGIRRPPHDKVGLYVEGHDIHVGIETDGRIHTKDLLATRYIGARDEIASKSGIFSDCGNVDEDGYGNNCTRTA